MKKIKGISEDILLERLRDNDHTAFELLFRMYYPALVLFCAGIVQDQQQAEELVQNFFVHLWEKRTQLQPVARVKSYFFTSIKNASFNFLKKEGIRQHIFDELKQLVQDDIRFDPDLYVYSELQQKIKSVLDSLPPRCKEIFKKSRFQGMSNQQIADDLELSKRTVDTQISKALGVLKKELKEYSTFLMFINFF